MRAEVVDLVGRDGADQVHQADAVGEVAVVELQALGWSCRWSIRVRLSDGRPPDEPVHVVTLVQQEFCQVGAVLPGDAGDESLSSRSCEPIGIGLRPDGRYHGGSNYAESRCKRNGGNQRSRGQTRGKSSWICEQGRGRARRRRRRLHRGAPGRRPARPGPHGPLRRHQAAVRVVPGPPTTPRTSSPTCRCCEQRDGSDRRAPSRSTCWPPTWAAWASSRTTRRCACSRC